MNCKQGDLAIVVKTSPENEHNLGKIVRCVRFLGDINVDLDGVRFITSDGNRWEIAHPLPIDGGRNLLYSLPDSCLRPIRGDLLDNETERETERAA